MRYKYLDWENHINSISKELKGQLKIVKSPSLGDELEYLNSEFLINYKDENISVKQLFIKTDYENGVTEKLRLIYEFENRLDFYLQINRSDFFDRFFRKDRIKTGDTLFDKNFTIKSNDERAVKKIFEKKELQDILIYNKAIILNIKTHDRKTKIELKNMIKKLYSIDEYKNYISGLKHIIDCLKF